MPNLDSLPIEVLDRIINYTEICQPEYPFRREHYLGGMCRSTQAAFERPIFEELWLDYNRLATFGQYMTEDRLAATRWIYYRVVKAKFVEDITARHDEDLALQTQELNELFATLTTLCGQFSIIGQMTLQLAFLDARMDDNATVLPGHKLPIMQQCRAVSTLRLRSNEGTFQQLSPKYLECCPALENCRLSMSGRGLSAYKDASSAVARMPKAVTDLELEYAADHYHPADANTYNIQRDILADNLAAVLPQLVKITLRPSALDLGHFFSMCTATCPVLREVNVEVKPRLPDGSWYFQEIRDEIWDNFPAWPSEYDIETADPLPLAPSTQFEAFVIGAAQATSHMPDLQNLNVSIDAGDSWSMFINDSWKRAWKYKRLCRLMYTRQSGERALDWHVVGIQSVSTKAKQAWLDLPQAPSIGRWPAEQTNQSQKGVAKV